jgi:hypothetical protein
MADFTTWEGPGVQNIIHVQRSEMAGKGNIRQGHHRGHPGGGRGITEVIPGAAGASQRKPGGRQERHVGESLWPIVSIYLFYFAVAGNKPACNLVILR